MRTDPNEDRVEFSSHEGGGMTAGFEDENESKKQADSNYLAWMKKKMQRLCEWTPTKTESRLTATKVAG